MVDKKNLKKGDKIKVIADKSNHKYPIGSVLTFRNHRVVGSQKAIVVFEGSNVLYFDEFKTGVTMQDIENEISHREGRIKIHNAEIELLKQKLEFMKECKLVFPSIDSFDVPKEEDVLDEEGFDTYRTIKLLEKENIPIVEKALLIKKIFKK